ncbi:hypothetical protein [Streptomyces sp. ME19-01-6]|uniref:hypothetical protein n=1 Tax=Streptomyces sp. ME19-01-6 TaxID=3028686 RepID=UPI0029BBF47A|nr:hypothetical protein [Streptomyces sp. ME19-01-6]MDX3233679.1 hypothetical protein [Streptomyces sp. ME19-01-6]
MTRTDGRPQVALVLLCAAVFLDSMDLSLMGVALPAIGRDLSLPESTLQCLMSGYAVAYGGFLLLGGRIANSTTPRRPPGSGSSRWAWPSSSPPTWPAG